MKEILYARTARMIVETCTRVQPGEQVLVITDSHTTQFGIAIATACQAVGAEVVFAEMTPRITHGYEPPRVIAAAMAAADVIFSPTTYAIAHTNANRAALAAGARHMILRSMTEELWLSGAMNADYEAIGRRTTELANRITKAARVHIQTELGTDLSFSIEGRPCTPMIGRLNDVPNPDGSRRVFDGMPNGKTSVSVVEGTAEGVLVYDGSMDGLGRLDAPMRLEISKGRIRSVTGGISAENLKQIMAEAGVNSDNIAEFGLGTNPASRLTGNIGEDKRILGSAHIAIGDNRTIGGVTESNIHLDGLIPKPTIHLDDEVIINRGSFVIDIEQ